MNTVLELLKQAKSGGLAIRSEGTRLIIRSPRRLEPLARKLLEHKPEVLNILAYDVPAGWSQRSWIDRLRYLASICVYPPRAVELRNWADGLEMRLDSVRGDE